MITFEYVQVVNGEQYNIAVTVCADMPYAQTVVERFAVLFRLPHKWQLDGTLYVCVKDSTQMFTVVDAFQNALG